MEQIFVNVCLLRHRRPPLILQLCHIDFQTYMKQDILSETTSNLICLAYIIFSVECFLLEVNYIHHDVILMVCLFLVHIY